jgi:hypothetical protein
MYTYTYTYLMKSAADELRDVRREQEHGLDPLISSHLIMIFMKGKGRRAVVFTGFGWLPFEKKTASLFCADTTTRHARTYRRTCTCS